MKIVPKLMNYISLIEITGWLGVIFYVLAYLFLSLGIVKSNSFSFHLMNMSGAVGLIIYSIKYADKPNVVVNVVWLLIGIFAVSRKLLSKLPR